MGNGRYEDDDLTAASAANISRISKKYGWDHRLLSPIKNKILEAAGQGLCDITVYLDLIRHEDYNKFFESKGFKLTHIFDENNTYRGTTINWEYK